VPAVGLLARPRYGYPAADTCLFARKTPAIRAGGAPMHGRAGGVSARQGTSARTPVLFPRGHGCFRHGDRFGRPCRSSHAHAPRPPFAHRSLLAVTAFLAATAGYVQTSRAASLPPHFQANAKADVGASLRCVVGNGTDADGLNARAWVTVEDTNTHKIRWATPVPLDKRWYQNQATHCLGDGNRVLAVIQSDTASETLLSQTFIEVATLDADSGHLESLDPVKIPDVHGAASAFVDEGEANFRLVDGKPVVSGEYF
jgi:hypothetical protein